MSNEDIKMSDLMYLPVHGHITEEGNAYAFDQAVFSQSKGHFGLDVTNSECDPKEAINAVCHAINNHDPMALRIKELEAALLKVTVKANCGENGLNDQGYFLIQDILEVANSALDNKALEQSK